MGLYFYNNFAQESLYSYMKIGVDGLLYSKPKVRILLNDLSCHTEYFDSLEDARLFFEELTKDKTFLQL